MYIGFTSLGTQISKYVAVNTVNTVNTVNPVNTVNTVNTSALWSLLSSTVLVPL